nr:MAG TPA: hypothetical protein [Caudoviricetes sp.]
MESSFLVSIGGLLILLPLFPWFSFACASITLLYFSAIIILWTSDKFLQKTGHLNVLFSAQLLDHF